MRTHVPVRITIHHTGVAQDPRRSVESKLIGLQTFSQRDDSLASGRKKPAWADVPYHYYVAMDGAVAEGREWRFVGDSNTPYDPTGHLLIVVEGNFERDTLSSAQRKTLDILVPSQARRFRIPEAALGDSTVHRYVIVVRHISPGGFFSPAGQRVIPLRERLQPNQLRLDTAPRILRDARVMDGDADRHVRPHRQHRRARPPFCARHVPHSRRNPRAGRGTMASGQRQRRKSERETDSASRRLRGSHLSALPW